LLLNRCVLPPPTHRLSVASSLSMSSGNCFENSHKSFHLGTSFHKLNWAISWHTYLIKLRTRGSPLLGHFLWLLPSLGLGKIVQNYNSVVAREDGTQDPWWVSRTCLVIRCKVNPYIITYIYTIKISASAHRTSE